MIWRNKETLKIKLNTASTHNHKVSIGDQEERNIIFAGLACMQ